MASSSATRCRICICTALPRVAVENRQHLGRAITYCSSRPRCRCCGQRLGILARRHPTFCEILCTSTCFAPCLSCRLCKNEANFLWQQTLCPNHCERVCTHGATPWILLAGSLLFAFDFALLLECISSIPESASALQSLRLLGPLASAALFITIENILHKRGSLSWGLKFIVTPSLAMASSPSPSSVSRCPPSHA